MGKKCMDRFVTKYLAAEKYYMSVEATLGRRSYSQLPCDCCTLIEISLRFLLDADYASKELQRLQYIG